MSLTDNIRKIGNFVEVSEIAILIWGSGSGGGEHHKKRLKVRETLATTFPKASIHFSEDRALKQAVRGAKYLSIPEQELWHLTACNVCIVLDTSKGSGEEIAHFVGSGHAHKLLILTHEQYKGSTSFPAALRKRQNQIFYSEDDYRSCKCVEQIIARVRQVALAMYSSPNGPA